MNNEGSVYDDGDGYLDAMENANGPSGDPDPPAQRSSSAPDSPPRARLSFATAESLAEIPVSE